MIPSPWGPCCLHVCCALTELLCWRDMPDPDHISAALLAHTRVDVLLDIAISVPPICHARRLTPRRRRRRFITPVFDFKQELRQHLQAAMEAVFQRQHSLADFAASPQLGLPLPAFLDSFKKANHYEVPIVTPGFTSRQQLLGSMPELALLVGPAAGAHEASLVPSPVMHLKALLREKVEGLPAAPGGGRAQQHCERHHICAGLYHCVPVCL